MTDDLAEHVFDEFPLLLSGEADRPTVFRVSTHLRECADCKDELVDAVTAHATLMSAARYAPDIATGGRLPWQGESAALVHGARADVASLLDAAAATGPATHVDLGPVFAQIRAEAEASAAESAGSAAGSAGGVAASGTAPVSSDAGAVAEPISLDARRRTRWRRGLAAAAAVVVIGGGAAIATTELGPQGRTVTVGAFGAGRVSASAQIGDGWMKLDASRLPALPSDQYYEVWLVDPARTGLLPLGSLSGNRTGTFAVPASVMSAYNSIQVTVQDNNGNPAPSNTSVLRATF